MSKDSKAKKKAIRQHRERTRAWARSRSRAACTGENSYAKPCAVGAQAIPISVSTPAVNLAEMQAPEVPVDVIAGADGLVTAPSSDNGDISASVDEIAEGAEATEAAVSNESINVPVPEGVFTGSTIGAQAAPVSYEDAGVIEPVVEEIEDVADVTDEPNKLTDEEISRIAAAEVAEVAAGLNDEPVQAPDLTVPFSPISPSSPLSTSESLAATLPVIETGNTVPLDPHAVRERREIRRPRKKKASKALIVVLIALIVCCLAAVAVIASMFSSDEFMTEAEEAAVMNHWGIAQEDAEMMAAEGYDGEKLTDDVEGFCMAFFTFDADSVESGAWQKSFSEYVAPKADIVDVAENLIYAREKSSWKEVFEEHPYYASKTISCDRIAWYIMPTSTVNVPYCDVQVTVRRCPLESYSLNSPALVFNDYLDRYRIVFDAGGNIVSCKRIGSQVAERDTDPNAAEADAAAYARKYGDIIDKAKKDREDALKEAQERAAEEEAQKAAEDEKSSNSKGTSGSKGTNADKKDTSDKKGSSSSSSSSSAKPKPSKPSSGSTGSSTDTDAPSDESGSGSDESDNENAD